MLKANHGEHTVRKPYLGLTRSLVIAIDVGTTYSGVSYAILEPGEVPVIYGVTRFPGQEHVAGNSKIPSLLYYDKAGRMMCAGAEADAITNGGGGNGTMERAEDEGWIRVELFKLRLRPVTMHLTPTALNGLKLPPLPRRKTPVHVFGDWLGYLFRCTLAFIRDTHSDGPELLSLVLGEDLPNFLRGLEADSGSGYGYGGGYGYDGTARSVREGKILPGRSAGAAATLEFVLAHPNGWEGAQQAKMRRAAVWGGLVPDTPAGRARIRFVSEGEAALHACVLSGVVKGALNNRNPNTTFVIADAGGGTLDISSYKIRGTNPFVMEEVAPADCIFAGSVFVSRRAREFFEHKLRGSQYGTPDSLDHITRRFDETTKRLFRDRAAPQFVPFGSPFDRDVQYDIKSGQLRLSGAEVANLFEPSIDAACTAIRAQIEASGGIIKCVFLVGGYAASPWLFGQLQERLGALGLTVSRPDMNVWKAVADGAVGFYCDHHVSARMSRFMYGVEYLRAMDWNDTGPGGCVERQARMCELPSGPKLLPDAFDCILARGVRVKETAVFSRKYCTELTSLSMLKAFEVEIWCYRGKSKEIPRWIERADDVFSTLCTVRADLSPLASSAIPKTSNSGPNAGKTYWTIIFSVEIHFGLTEFRARIKWIEGGTGKDGRTGGVIKYGPATIVYNERGHRLDEDEPDFLPEDEAITGSNTRPPPAPASDHERSHSDRQSVRSNLKASSSSRPSTPVDGHFIDASRSKSGNIPSSANNSFREGSIREGSIREGSIRESLRESIKHTPPSINRDRSGTPASDHDRGYREKSRTGSANASIRSSHRDSIYAPLSPLSPKVPLHSPKLSVGSPRLPRSRPHTPALSYVDPSPSSRPPSRAPSVAPTPRMEAPTPLWDTAKPDILSDFNDRPRSLFDPPASASLFDLAAGPGGPATSALWGTPIDAVPPPVEGWDGWGGVKGQSTPPPGASPRLAAASPKPATPRAVAPSVPPTPKPATPKVVAPSVPATPKPATPKVMAPSVPPTPKPATPKVMAPSVPPTPKHAPVEVAAAAPAKPVVPPIDTSVAAAAAAVPASVAETPASATAVTPRGRKSTASSKKSRKAAAAAAALVEKEKAEAEAKAKEEAEAKAKEEAERKAKEEAEAKAKAEEEAKAKEEAERKAKEEAEKKAKEEAEAKAKAEEEAKAKEEAEAKAKAEEEAKAKEEADKKVKEEAEAKAKAEEEAKAKEEAEAKAKAEEEAKAKEEADKKVKEEAEAKAKAEEEVKAKEEAEKKAKEEADAKAKAEEEAKAKEEAEAKAKAEEEAKAKEEAEKKAKEEADAKAKAEEEAKAKEEAEAKAKAEEEAKAKEEAEKKAKEEAEAKAKEEADKKAKEEAEAKAKAEEEAKAKEAEAKAKAEEEAKAKEEADKRAKEEAEKKAKEEAERKAKEEADAKAKEEAEAKAKEEAQRKEKEEAEAKAKAKEEEEAKAKAAAEAKAKEEEDAAKAKAQAEAQAKEKEEAEAKANAEAEAKAKEEAEAKAKEEAEKKAKEEAEKKAREEAEAKAKAEEEAKAKEEADKKAKEEADKKAKEEAEVKAKEEADKKAKEEEEAKAKAKAEAEAKAKEEADKKAKEDADKKAKEAEEDAAEEAARQKAADAIKRAEQEEKERVEKAAQEAKEAADKKKAEEEEARVKAAEEEKKQAEEDARLKAEHEEHEREIAKIKEKEEEIERELKELEKQEKERVRLEKEEREMLEKRERERREKEEAESRKSPLGGWGFSRKSSIFGGASSWLAGSDSKEDQSLKKKASMTPSVTDISNRPSPFGARAKSPVDDKAANTSTSLFGDVTSNPALDAGKDAANKSNRLSLFDNADPNPPSDANGTQPKDASRVGTPAPPAAAKIDEAAKAPADKSVEADEKGEATSVEKDDEEVAAPTKTKKKKKGKGGAATEDERPGTPIDVSVTVDDAASTKKKKKKKK